MKHQVLTYETTADCLKVGDAVMTKNPTSFPTLIQLTDISTVETYNDHGQQMVGIGTSDGDFVVMESKDRVLVVEWSPI